MSTPPTTPPPTVTDHRYSSKSLLRSKTFWLQVLSMAGVFYPPVQAWLVANPVTAVAALAAANTLVRLVTSGRVSVFTDGDEPPANGGSTPGGALLCMFGTAAALATALPSCAPGFPLRLSAELEEGTLSYSSKGGLNMEYKPGYGQMPAAYAERPTPNVERRAAK